MAARLSALSAGWYSFLLEADKHWGTLHICDDVEKQLIPNGI
jgi:hypothetical protein